MRLLPSTNWIALPRAAVLAVALSGQAAADERGITGITQSPAALTIPHELPSEEKQRYGLAFPFQVGPRTAALLVNLLVLGKGVGDFENGSDVVLFDDLLTLARQGPVPITRNTLWTDSTTGEKRILVKYPDLGGFVPLGARRADGSSHPGAGSGFSLCEALDFPREESGAFRASAKPRQKLEVHQHSFDGRRFRVVHTELFPQDRPLQVADSRWHLVAAGLTMAIPDGDDLLQPVVASDGASYCGVARWRVRDGIWRPVAFTAVPETDGLFEPSLARDLDGSLLLTARAARKDERKTVNAYAIRIWDSRDGGASWQRRLDVPETRDSSPLAIGSAADQTVFVLGNPVQPDHSYFRAALWLWPIRSSGGGLAAPLVVRDATAEFGRVAAGARWKIDHANPAVVRLADGRWRGVIAYRVMTTESLKAGAAPHERTGCYVEEVRSRGPIVPPWNFPD